jgi:hypothetical protein
MSSPPRLAAAVLIGLLAAGAFGSLLKLMNEMSRSMADMTRDIASMAADMHRMGSDITALSEQVAGIRLGVDAMAGDVRGMRVGVDRMSAVIQTGGKQIEQINPMGIMQQLVPPASGR